MSMIGVWGWDTANTRWRKIHVDAAGDLQVDVLTSALPAGGATAANQALIIADTGTLVTEQGRCYGYDGANWQTLLVESAAYKNLRVRLYAQDNIIAAGVLGSALPHATAYGLATKALVHAKSGASTVMVEGLDNLDARTPTTAHLAVATTLRGYNGATWDRLRSYGVGILKVGRAEVGLLDVRMTGTGQVGAVGARRLYWMLLNPSAGNSITALTDAVAGGAAVKADHFDTARDGHMLTFDPPLEFSNGIWLETFANMTSITFGYL